MNQAPHHYPRRVLLCVAGLTPQVVTETLYALAVRQKPPFIPTEVHVITTSEGASRIRLALLSETKRWFRRLLEDYGLPEITFTADHIHVVKDGSGKPLDDIRTPEDNAFVADFITEKVRELTSDENAALHVSLAGGRKTMSYYMGYALSLFGREQDRLSHVLVSAPYETNPEFYYPTPYEFLITTRENKLIDAREAEVILAEIPFVRMREWLPKSLLEHPAPFRKVVEAAERAKLPPRLRIDLKARRAWAYDVELDLTDTQFLFLVWLAKAGEEGRSYCDPEDARAFVDLAYEMFGEMSARTEEIERSVAGWQGDPQGLKDYFQPHASRLKRALKEALGEKLAERFCPVSVGKRNALRHRLPPSVEVVWR